MGVCEDKAKKADKVDSLGEKGFVEVEKLFCAGISVLEWVPRERKAVDDEDEFVCFALAESGSEREVGKRELFKVEKGSGV